MPKNAQAIKEAFRSNLEERQKKLINQSYVSFGTTNATELIRRFVPKGFAASKLTLRSPKKEAQSVTRAAMRLSQADLDRVIKDSYKTLITIKAKAEGG